MKDQPLITLDKISVRLYDTLYLQNITWQIKTNEQWAIVGPNGSGKTTLAKALFGGVPVVRGSVTHHLPPTNGDTILREDTPSGMFLRNYSANSLNGKNWRPVFGISAAKFMK